MGEEKKKTAEEVVEEAKNMGAAEAGPGYNGSEPPEPSNSTSTELGDDDIRSDIGDIEVPDQQFYGWFSDSGDMVLPETDITSRMKSAENPRKSPRLSNSALTGKVLQINTDRTWCEHLSIAYEDLEFILQGIDSAVSFPDCEHYFCETDSQGPGLMVCLECDRHFCCTGLLDWDNPRGHAREHANISLHRVALWYNEPYSAFCFYCERVLRLDEYMASYNCGVEDGNGKDEWMVEDGNGKDEWMVEDGNEKDERRKAARYDDWESAGAIGNGYVINGLLNLGNTCYMNALVQCLLALGKLRTMMLGPDAPSGSLGVRLKDFFLETSSAARRTLIPQNLLEHIHELFPKFTPNQMHDSHELLKSLCDTLDREAQELNMHSVIDSIFRGQLYDIISCNRCSNTSVTHSTFDDLAVPLPSKGPPATSTALPQVTKKCRSATPRIRRNLFPTIDDSNEETVQAISEGGDSQVPCSQLGDMDVEKIPKPLQVDSTEVKQISQRKDVVHCSLQENQKNVVPGGIIEVPVKADNFEGIGQSTADSLNPGDIDLPPPPPSSPEAEEIPRKVEGTAEYKGKTDSSDIAYDEARHVNSVGSIDDCLSLLLEKHTIEWRCENCSKVAELPSTSSIKHSEQKMASTNVSTKADGDHPEQSGDLNGLTVEHTSSSSQPHDSIAQHQLSLDRITKGNTSGVSYDEKYPAPCRPDNQFPECHEVVQEAKPSYLPTDKQANPLIAQDSQDVSTQNQGSGKQVKLDDHSAHQVEENPNEQKDRNDLPIQTHFISKLPPVLTIQIKRYSSELVKLEGHVSFKEVLDVGPFMDPSCEDKDNSRYRLAGIVEHYGPNLSVGHYVAYVRGGPKPQSSDSSSLWYRASDTDIKEVSVEEVLKREAYLLFYERVEDQGIEPTN